ncbi:MAG: tetratricopeptide repeat protein [Candidatus Binatia bacterium]|nr:tetratricopeptide repeat protein [Candidatus Binatia bacterium]
MEARFCAFCGAARHPGGRYCTHCGRPFHESKRLRFKIPARWAPLFVLGSVLAISSVGIVHGLLFPAPKGGIKRGEASAKADLPADHPPIELPQQVKDAIRELVERAKAAPDDLELWRQAAQAQYRAAMFDPTYLPEARNAYEHIAERVPGDLEALRALGNIAYEQRQPSVAVNYYEQYLAKKPDDLEVRTDLGTMLLALGQSEKALETYRAVLRENPNFFQAHFNLGVAYHGLGKEEEAKAAFARARETAPDEGIRAQVDQLIARLSGEEAPGTSATQGPAGAEGETTFRTAAENLFRQNPVMGPKVDRIEWVSDGAAKVYVRDFPMEQMGSEMRNLFRERMLSRIREQKGRFQIARAVRFDVVDSDSGRVMETLAE